MIDKSSLIKWVDENWELERTSGSINGGIRAVVWHEINDKVRDNYFVTDDIERFKDEYTRMKKALEVIAYYDDEVKLSNYTDCVMHARSALFNITRGI